MIHFKMLYNYGMVNVGTYYVIARSKTHAKKLATLQGLQFTTEPKRISAKQYHENNKSLKHRRGNEG